MNNFDNIVNYIISENLLDKELINKRKKQKKRIKRILPNTPGNRPVSNKSPAVRGFGMPGTEIAQTPIPLQIGV